MIGFGSAAAGVAAAGLVPNSSSREAGAAPAAGLVPKSSSRELGAAAGGLLGWPLGGSWTSVPSMYLGATWPTSAPSM
ncbi:MAG: hypothetical protein ACREVP_19090 [Burkholderiales bacterium]